MRQALTVKLNHFVRASVVVVALLLAGCQRQSAEDRHHQIRMGSLHVQQLVVRYRLELGKWPQTSEEIFTAYPSLMTYNYGSGSRSYKLTPNDVQYSGKPRGGGLSISLTLFADEPSAVQQVELNEVTKLKATSYWESYGKPIAVK